MGAELTIDGDWLIALAANAEPFDWSDVPESTASALVTAAIETQSAGVQITARDWVELSPISRAAWAIASGVMEASREVARAELAADPLGYASRASRPLFGSELGKTLWLLTREGGGQTDGK